MRYRPATLFVLSLSTSLACAGIFGEDTGDTAEGGDPHPDPFDKRSDCGLKEGRYEIVGNASSTSGQWAEQYFTGSGILLCESGYTFSFETDMSGYFECEGAPVRPSCLDDRFGDESSFEGTWDGNTLLGTFSDYYYDEDKNREYRSEGTIEMWLAD